jgi:hypothetical protein
VLISPEFVRRELERALDVRADRFAHHYDIGFDRFVYRFDANGRTLIFPAASADHALSLNDFCRKVIEPAAAEFRGEHG